MIALWRARRTSLAPERGLLISKTFYRALGGYSDRPDTEVDFLRRVGKRRMATLRSGLIPSGDATDT